MPTYEVTAPDGHIYEVTAPAGASQDDVMKYVQSQHASAPTGPPPTAFQSLLNNPVSRAIHDTVSPIAGALPVIGPALQGLGMDKAFSQAQAAGQNTPGYQAARQSEDATSAAAGSGIGGFVNQMVAPVLPATRAIEAYGGQALRNLTGKPGGTTAVDAANAAYDSTQASLQGFQSEHPYLSTAAALAPAVAGMAGPATRALAGFGNAARTAKTIDQLKSGLGALRQQASQAYGVVNRSGMQIAPTALDDLLNDIYSTNVNGARLIKPKMNTTLYPKAASALDELQTARKLNQPLSMSDLAELRTSAGDAASDYSASNADRMRAHIIKNGIDKFVENLSPAQMNVAGVAPDAAAIANLQTARGLWAKQAQGSEMLRIIEKAQNDAGSNFAQAGFEQALRRRFKNLANNDNAWRSLSPDMQKAVKAVNDGGKLDTVLRKIGAWAPQGKLMQGLEFGGLLTAFATGNPFIIAGAAGIPAAGQIARSVGTARTFGRAADTVNLAMGGKPLAGSVRPPSMNLGLPAVTPYLLLQQRANQGQ